MKKYIKRKVSIFEDPFERRKAEYTLVAFLLVLLYSLLNVFPMAIELTLSPLYMGTMILYVGLLFTTWFLIGKKKLLLAQIVFISSGFLVGNVFYYNDLYFHFYTQFILVLFVQVIIHLYPVQVIFTEIMIIVLLINKIITLNQIRLDGTIDVRLYNVHIFLIVSVLSLFVFINYFSQIIERDIKEKIKLNNMADIDVLTGLHNRDYYNTLVKTYHQNDILYQLCIIDIDHFKNINDRHGHAIGDQILKTLSKMMVESFDGDNYDISRWGGEEFIILIKHMKIADSYVLLEKFRKKVMHHDFDVNQPVTVSMGISEYDFELSDERMFSIADDFLYKAKENGRNQIVMKEEIHV